MMKKFQMIFVLGWIALGASVAYAGVAVDLVGTGTYSTAVGSPSTLTGKASFPGAGLQLHLPLSSRISFNLGGLYLIRVWNDGIDRTSRYMEGLAGFNLYLSRVFHLNLDGYYNYIVNDPVGLLGPDWGFSCGLGMRIPLGGSVGLLINPRYNVALNTQNYNGSNTVRPSEAVLLLGLTFGMPMGGSR